MTIKTAFRSVLCLALLAMTSVAMGTRPAVAAENGKTLRVCSDPDYMPYSNRAEQGFENKIAQVVAKALGRKLEYHWSTQRAHGGFSNFLALGLDAHKCDVVLDIPYGDPEELYTKSYYESSYVFVYKKSKGYDITSMDSPQLRHVKVGYEADTPPETGLKLRGLVQKATPFHVADNPKLSPKSMLEAVQNGKVDVMITWEPAIGYYMHEFPGLKMVRVPNTRSQGSPEQYAFAMAMAVRQGDTKLKNDLNKVIESHKGQLKAILNHYNVKLLPGGGFSPYYGE